MRLVDLDNKDLESYLETGTEEFARGVRFVWDALKEQPTVDAIPVEWLKKYFNHRMRNGKIWYYDVKEDKLYQAWKVDDIIDDCCRDWEKENDL